MSKNYLLEGKPDAVYAVLTLKCNSRCKHCYLEASSDREESMPMSIRKKVVDEVAKSGIAWLILSGGEPTTEMEKLADTIEYASDSRKKTGYPKYVMLQTNAYFLKGLDDGEIRNRLEEFKSKGVTELNITSGDSYHRISKNEIEKIRKVANGVFGVNIDVIWTAKKTVVPIGRARDEVPKKDWGKYKCSLNDVEMPPRWVSVYTDGGVYPCCWQATPPMGDLSKESLQEIFERTRRPDSLFRKLAEKGFSKMKPEELGLEISKDEFDKMIEAEGDCATCYQLYLPLKEKGNSKNGQK